MSVQILSKVYWAVRLNEVLLNTQKVVVDGRGHIEAQGCKFCPNCGEEQVHKYKEIEVFTQAGMNLLRLSESIQPSGTWKRLQRANIGGFIILENDALFALNIEQYIQIHKNYDDNNIEITSENLNISKAIFENELEIRGLSHLPIFLYTSSFGYCTEEHAEVGDE